MITSTHLTHAGSSCRCVFCYQIQISDWLFSLFMLELWSHSFFYIAFLSMVTHVQKKWKTVSFGVASMTLLLVLLETPLASSKTAWLTWPTTSISPSLTANTECFSFVGFMSIFKAPFSLSWFVYSRPVHLWICLFVFRCLLQQYSSRPTLKTTCPDTVVRSPWLLWGLWAPAVMSAWRGGWAYLASPAPGISMFPTEELA